MRTLVLGDGASGIAAASVIKDAVVLPTMPPKDNTVAYRAPFPMGPRYLYPSKGMGAMLYFANKYLTWVGSMTQRINFGFRYGDRYWKPEDVSPEQRVAYYRKSRPSEGSGPVSVPDSVATAGASSITVLRLDYNPIVKMARERLEREGRILEYVPIEKEPNPDVPFIHPVTLERFERVLYTCPARFLWPDLKLRSMPKVFAPLHLRAEAKDFDPGSLRWAYAYRYGDDVSWHRETRITVSKKGIIEKPGLLLEWTFPESTSPTEGLRFALNEISKRVFKPAHDAMALPVGQIITGSGTPEGTCWKPIGRLAEWKHGLLLNDAADRAMEIDGR